MEKRIGKIEKVHLGIGGYSDGMIGYNFTLGSKKDSWGVTTNFNGYWYSDVTEHTKWSEQDRMNALGKAFMELKKLLDDAGVYEINGLVGKPVEATFDRMQLVGWRILTEVL